MFTQLYQTILNMIFNNQILYLFILELIYSQERLDILRSILRFEKIFRLKLDVPQ